MENRTENFIDCDADFAEVLKKSANNAKKLPPYLQTLLAGTGTGIADDQPYPFPKPDWLDMDKLRRGQKFATDHLFGVIFATLISIPFTFTSRDMIKPIIFSGHSNSPFKAFKRYLSTISRIKSWYAGDIWQAGTEAHQNMKIVRGMHQRIKKKLDTSSKEEIAKNETNEGKPMWTDLHQELLHDFQACPALDTPLTGPKQVHVSQTDLTITQFGFVGLILLFPKMFGIHNASQEDLDAFAHLWRGIGYLLGIEDQFNLCTGNIEVVQQKCRDLLDFWMKPLLRYVSRDWVHMSRCLVSGTSIYARGMSFEVVMMYLTRILSIPTPKLAGALDVYQYFQYYYVVVLFKFFLRIPGAFRLMNWLMTRGSSRAQHASPQYMKRLASRVYPYETQGLCPMVQ